MDKQKREGRGGVGEGEIDDRRSRGRKGGTCLEIGNSVNEGRPDF